MICTYDEVGHHSGMSERHVSSPTIEEIVVSTVIKQIQNFASRLIFCETFLYCLNRMSALETQRSFSTWQFLATTTKESWGSGSLSTLQTSSHGQLTLPSRSRTNEESLQKSVACVGCGQAGPQQHVDCLLYLRPVVLLSLQTKNADVAVGTARFHNLWKSCSFL